MLLNAAQSYLEDVSYSDLRDSVARMWHIAAGITAHAVNVAYEQKEEVQELQQQLAGSQEQVGVLQQQLQAMQLQLQQQQQ